MPDLDVTIGLGSDATAKLRADGTLELGISSGIRIVSVLDTLALRDLLNRVHEPPFKNVDPDKLDDAVLSCIMQNMGWEPDEDEDCTKYAERLRTMSPRECFEKFLGWQGIRGYTDMIISALDNIREAAL